MSCLHVGWVLLIFLDGKFLSLNHFRTSIRAQRGKWGPFNWEKDRKMVGAVAALQITLVCQQGKQPRGDFVKSPPKSLANTWSKTMISYLLFRQNDNFAIAPSPLIAHPAACFDFLGAFSSFVVRGREIRDGSAHFACLFKRLVRRALRRAEALLNSKIKLF